jgi:hypothetical protein
MTRTVTLTLEMADVFQTLDALESRAIAYEKTAALLNGSLKRRLNRIEDPEARATAYLDELFCPEECRDAREAKEIARHFRDIIASISRQLDAVAA